ncbi:MAG: GNAT family N-acetyltransferase [Candidatus Omnitrophica bacterium]|jgi:predicted N-acyltransferase|nr:GNAT family N-acetyltransferase [Candidatus Omnitrophota bacterium]
MRKSKAPLTFTIVDTIRDIPRKDWDNLFSANPIEGYGYHRNIEEAHLKEFSFGYLIGERNSKIRVIIPFFIMNFSLDTLIPGPIHKWLFKLKRFLCMKVLFLGSPTTEEFYFGIARHEDLGAFLNKALPRIYEFAKENKVSTVAFNNLSSKNKFLGQALMRRNFIRMESLATTMIEIKAKSLEEYLASLSKNMRKDIKRKLRRSAEQTELKTEIRENIDDIIDRIYELYLNNFTDADVRFETLTPEFFKNICRNMPGVAKFFITHDKNKIVAFNLCFVENDLFIDKFIGFDKNLARKYHLYFTTFCYNFDWCIKNGIHYYQPGTTDYYPKIRLGAKLIPLYIYAKAFNPLLNTLVRLTAKWIEPKNIDSTLREIEEEKEKKHLKQKLFKR